MTPSKTLAMVQTDLRKLEPQDLPIPELRDDTALLRIEACGICGSDYEQYEGVLRTPMPVIPGHEPLGVIAAIGDTGGPPLGRRRGRPRRRRDHARVPLLRRLSARKLPPLPAAPDLLLHPALPGARALGRLRRVHGDLDPRSVVHKVDTSLPPGDGGALQPARGAGFRWAVEIPKTGPGDTVLILGPGQRGLASVLACREAGAARSS